MNKVVRVFYGTRDGLSYCWNEGEIMNRVFFSDGYLSTIGEMITTLQINHDLKVTGIDLRKATVPDWVVNAEFRIGIMEIKE